jgi:LuxR family maltose regulon positive regulatory protein
MLAEQLAAQTTKQPGGAPRTFAELAQERFPERPAIVFIDNWDFLETRELDQYLFELLQATDGVANFVVSARVPPKIAIEVYRISGEVAEFGTVDLKLDTETSLSVFSSLGPLCPSHGRLRRLLRPCEGWPAGVQLLRLAIQRSGSAADLHFSGTRESVANYLNETIFSRLSSEERNFLCHLSALDEISADLLIDVLQDAGAPGRFEHLRHENVLVNETSEGAASFRFHTLFRDFLLSVFDQYATMSRKELRAAAAAFYERRGEIVAAINYAIGSVDAIRCVEMVANYAEERLIADGRIVLFTEWVRKLISQGEALPPAVEYWYRWCLVFSGQWRIANAWSTASEEHQRPIIDAVIGAFSDDQPKLRHAVNAWTPHRSGASPFNLAVMYCAAAVAAMAQGELKAAWSQVNRAKLAISQTEGSFGRTWVHVIAVLVEILSGRLNDARVAAEAAVHEAGTHFYPNAHMARMARLCEALVAYYQDDRERARQALAFASTETDDHALPLLSIMAGAISRELDVYWEKRSFEERPPSAALALIAEGLGLERTGHGGEYPEGFARALAAFENRIDAARTIDQNVLRHGWILNDIWRVSLVRGLLARGDLDQAQSNLATALNQCQRDGRGLTEMRLSLLRVVALYRQGKASAALRLMLQQAERAVRDGLRRPFVEFRHMLQPLIPSLIETGQRTPIGNDPLGWQNLVASLGATADVKVSSPGALATMAGLEERLSVTPREVEILSFLDYGMTNAEIGRRLGISLPTVKWHLGNLYLKLNVKNRASAIRFARDNGLT